jgi:hypothetical protein
VTASSSPRDRETLLPMTSPPTQYFSWLSANEAPGSGGKPRRTIDKQRVRARDGRPLPTRFMRFLYNADCMKIGYP